jgi:hypothetical protein
MTILLGLERPPFAVHALLQWAILRGSLPEIVPGSVRLSAARPLPFPEVS